MKFPLHTRVRRTANRRLWRRSIAAGCFVTAVAGACTFGDSAPSRNSGFGSPAGAAEAFASDELPDVAPWDPDDGLCRVLMVGDSLVEATLGAQEDAFDFLGCESIVDGLAARTLSEGWQCLANGGESMSIIVRREAEPGNPTCRPAGLELLQAWSDFTPAASVTVIALGTNDAASFDDKGWTRHWKRAVDLTTGPIVFVTAAARPGDRWVDTVAAYNSALRTWCPSEPRCTLASWDGTEVANNRESYVDHVHLTRSAGEMRAMFIAVIARQVAVPAPSGPTRWRPPTISLPPATTSTVPSATGPVHVFPPSDEEPVESVSPTTTISPTTTVPGESSLQSTTTVPADSTGTL
ncbi:MAG: hypothetical protein ACKOI2_08185 [Actinomycetota bacterium]